MLAAALSAWHAPKTQVVVAGDPGDAATAALWREANRRYLPFAVVIPAAPAHHEALGAALPWTAPLLARAGRPTAYVCREFTCRLPVETPEALAPLLEEAGA
jgi:hypothetical protein